MILEYYYFLIKSYSKIYCLDSFSGQVKQKRLDIDPDFSKQYNLEEKEFDNKFDKQSIDFSG